MKTIGLLGGMSWESTESYYRLINSMVKERLGGLHSAKIAMISLDFSEIQSLQAKGAWEEAGDKLAEAALKIQAAGADFLVICTNTMHVVMPQICAMIDIPVLHIADATAEKVKSSNIRTVGLLGTKFTMEQEFYRGRLESKHDLRVIVPEKEDRETVHRIIFEELCQGKIYESSRRDYLRIMEDMRRKGAEGVIEGCTEIGLLVGPEHTDIVLFDTTKLHASAAVDAAFHDQ